MKEGAGYLYTAKAPLVTEDEETQVARSAMESTNTVDNTSHATRYRRESRGNESLEHRAREITRFGSFARGDPNNEETASADRAG
jgi:hypothetical protein